MHGAFVARRREIFGGPIDRVLGGAGVTVVTGPNGSGETTLLRLLHGAARITAGSIDWA